MHNIRKVTDDLVYLGVSDRRIELFENVYPIARGISYNSYLLLDEKTVLFDTVDRSVTGQFFENLEYALDGRKLDYLIVNHMEPDHSSAIAQVVHRYPEVKLLCTELAVSMIAQFHEIDIAKHGYTVTEGMELSTGRHRLIFTMAPMVHWPEVMMTYDATDKILFSADAFGTFGAPGGNLFADEVNFETEWLADARRYYTNIVGKYGPQVQDVLAKAAALDISMICPLHGPIWRENIGWFIDKYDKWSSYTPEEDAVLVVYGSVYGGTENAAGVLASKLSEGGARNVTVLDVSKTHVSELIAESFRCSHIVLASMTYNMGIFTPMKNFLLDLQAHNLQNRSYALVENGSWSPASGRLMQEILDQMPGMKQIGSTVTVRSTTNEESYASLCALAEEIIASLHGTLSDAPLTQAPAAAKWRCTVCGYVYEGDSLPADYTCPLCGVGADKFEQIS
ncbi:MAG: MBL fold metallo-hydrolase [Clostridia bacterium]|nr:MBL fold metallo-hydrolase [Clostridia bacterium]